MKSLSVLVADDHEEIRNLLRLWLETRGHTVACVGSGREALAEFKARRYDVLVTDVLMPDGGGVELITEIKRLRPRVRILAITGGGPHLASASCLHFAQSAGAHGLLLKPFKETQFFDALDRTYGHKPLVSRTGEAAG